MRFVLHAAHPGVPAMCTRALYDIELHMSRFRFLIGCQLRSTLASLLEPLKEGTVNDGKVWEEPDLRH